MKGFKDLNECGKVGHQKLQLYQKNGKYGLIGLNTCKKPCCPRCLPKLLYKQQNLINQAISYAKKHNLKVSMWTINLPKNSVTQSLMFMRSKLNQVITDFLRVTTRSSKVHPINKTLKHINQVTGSVGYIYRNEISVRDNKFNPHIQLLDFRNQILTEEQKHQLTESLIQICERNQLFISKRQSFKVHEVILDFKTLTFSKDQNSYSYLTKIDNNDAIKLAESDEEKYQELCKSQILLNSKANHGSAIPLIYWKPKLKKLMGIVESKFQIEDAISIPENIINFAKFHNIKPTKIVQIVNSVGDIHILQNPLIFDLLESEYD